MVRRFIDMDTFEKGLRSAKDRNLKRASLPRGLSMKQFQTFRRVMAAEDSSEIADVSAEELATLYVKAEELVSMICADSVLEKPEEMMCAIRSCSAVSLKRRIL